MTFSRLARRHATAAIGPAAAGTPGADIVAKAKPDGYTPLLLTVNPNVAARDVKSFVALAKSNPGGLRFASSGGGSAQHLAAARFQLATDLETQPWLA